jgi:hypothetical protein
MTGFLAQATDDQHNYQPQDNGHKNPADYRENCSQAHFTPPVE